MTRTSISATTECDVFFVQKILQVVFLINFCACPFPRVKYKGDVLGHQLFEAYLPSLLHRLYKQRRWRVSKRVQEAKKVKRPGVNGLASTSFQSQDVENRVFYLLILSDSSLKSTSPSVKSTKDWLNQSSLFFWSGLV